MTTKQKNPSAFMKPVNFSEELAAIVGRGPLPRTEITKRVWDYIKKHNLQAKDNRKNIQPDEKLSKVLGKGTIDMFQMTKKINVHIRTEAAAASR